MTLIYIGISMAFLAYFLTGIFYIMGKPKIIINRKLNKIQRVHNITDVQAYFNGLGKLNLYMSFLFYLPIIIGFYMDETNHSIWGGNLIPLIYFYLLFNVFEKRYKRKLNKYLVNKDSETIDSIN